MKLASRFYENIFKSLQTTVDNYKLNPKVCKLSENLEIKKRKVEAKFKQVKLSRSSC